MALNPKYLDSLPDSLVEMYSLVEIDILEDMARRISTYDYFIPAALHQNQKLQELGMVQEHIIQALSAMTGQTQAEIVALLTEASEEAVADDVEYYKRADVYKPTEINSEALHKQLNSGLLQTQQAFKNITRTTANTATKQFENALDRAWTQIMSGGMDYTTAISRAIKDLAKQGVGAIAYSSGRVDSIEVAVRRAVVTGANQTAAKAQEVLADELGVELVEVTAHGGARPEHAKWQGKVFSRHGDVEIDGVKYKDLKKATGYGTGAGLGGWNCRHNFHPYIPGAPRTWTDKELKKLDEKNITYNGEKYSEYEASQIQRGIERDIRSLKRQVAAIEAGGGDASAERSKLRKAQKGYTDFTEQTGLKKQSARTQTADVKTPTTKEIKEQRTSVENKTNREANYMSAVGSSVNLYATKETKHSTKELQHIETYAKENGVKIFQSQKFDGDTEVLRGEIDVLSELKTEFKYMRDLTITFDKLDKDDLAVTSPNGKSITFNVYALRDRALTNQYLTSDNILSSTDIRGIAAHEMGHVLQTSFGNKGLDIARKVYYNIYGENVSNAEIINYLHDNISVYSVARSETNKNKPPKSKYFKEIIPEIMGKNATNPNDFTTEFVKILKKEWNV